MESVRLLICSIVEIWNEKWRRELLRWIKKMLWHHVGIISPWVIDNWEWYEYHIHAHRVWVSPYLSGRGVYYGLDINFSTTG